VRISDHDLRQLDAESVHRLVAEHPHAVEPLMVRLVDDLKEARERLNQNPDNSSRPPSSRDPWSRTNTPPPAETDGSKTTDPAAEEADETPKSPPPSRRKPDADAPSRKAGKQNGAPGHARTQTLEVAHWVDHKPGCCARCRDDLPPDRAICYTSYQDVDVVFGDADRPGLHLTCTEHRYYMVECERCGHITRAEPYRAPPAQDDWAGVEIAEWRLIGPALAGLLVWLHFGLHLSTRRCRLLCGELLGLSLSVGAIAQTFHESGRACAPVRPKIEAEVREAELVNGDETPHYEGNEFLWLWVLASATSVLFFIGRRTKELLQRRLGADFAGWLMADGYGAYREYQRRLRCWAHLIRKARALAETFTPHVQGYGLELLKTFDLLIDKVYQARAGPRQDLRPLLADELARLKTLCEKMARSQNDKARQLGREFLNDWDAIFQVLAHPHLPLTNNYAERLLRHWVILRRITQGTRTLQGSLTLATFASIIETCRLRQASPYLHQAIAAGRKGLALPALPPVPVAS
jgi:transposase